MTVYTKPMVVPASVSVGAALDAKAIGQILSLLVVGAFTGTYQLEASPDNINWVIEGAPFTAPVIRAVVGAPFYRLNCTAFTSAPAGVFLHGRN